MIRNTTRISIEDLRRNLGLPPHFTVTDISVEDNCVVVEAESPVIPGKGVNKIPGEDLTNIIRAINKSRDTGKEIIFNYYNEKRDGIEITDRKFIPKKWINDDCIEGIDLDRNAVRRFCPSRMEWVECVVTL